MEDPAVFSDLTACLKVCDSLQVALGLIEVVPDGSGRPHDIRFLQVNDAFTRLAGLPAGSLAGRTSRQFNPAMAPFALEEFGRLGPGSAPLHFEKLDRVLGKWLEVRAAPCGEGRLIVLIGNVSGRRSLESELEATRERLQAIFEHAPSGICVAKFPPDGQIIYVNPTSVAITGYELSDVPTLTEWHEKAFPDPAYRAEVIEGLLRDFEEGYRSREGIYRVTCRDGAVKEVQFRASMLPDGTLITFANDVSGIRRVEEALRELNETLESRVAGRTRLAEGRSSRLQALALKLAEAEEGERRRIVELLHDDLQQLLAGARYKLELLQHGGAVDEAARAIVRKVGQILEESIQKTRRLSHDLSPQVLLQADLGPALEWLARQMEEDHGLRVRLQAGGPLPVDNGNVRAFLFRAVRELLFNVVKHAGVAEATVSVACADGRLEIAVSDRGRGFAPEEAKSGGGPAGGLGLDSIGERAGLFGGGLQMESVPGQGSRLTLSLPLPAAPPAARG